MKDKMASPKELPIHSTWKGGKGSGHRKYLIGPGKLQFIPLNRAYNQFFSGEKGLFSSLWRKVRKGGIGSDPEGRRPKQLPFCINNPPQTRVFINQSINLQPSKLMGAESQGMILAAEGPDGVILATFGKGAKVESKFR
jgi:hypothetical protein